VTSQATLVLVIEISESDVSRPDAPNPISMRHLARICRI